MPEPDDDQKDLKRGALAFLAGAFPRAAAGVTFLTLAGNLFGLEGFGAYAVAIAALELTGAVCVLGMKRSLFPAFARAEGNGHDPAAINGIVLNALVTAGTLAIVAGGTVYGLLWPLWDQDRALAVLLLGLPLILMADIVLAATRHRRRNRYQVIARSVIEPWGKVAGVAIFWAMALGTSGLAYAYLMGLAGAVLYALWGYHRLYSLTGLLRARADIGQCRDIFRAGLPVGISEIAEMGMRRADVVLLGAISGAPVAGAYQAAKEIATLAQKTVQMFEPMLAPILAQAMGRGDHDLASRHLCDVVRWCFALQWGLLILLGGYAGQILSLIGPGFDVAALMVVILLIGECFGASLSLALLPIQYHARSLSPLISAAAAGVLIVGGALGAILADGVGMALGFAAALTVQGLTAAIVARSRLHVASIEARTLLPLIPALAAGGLLLVLNPTPLTDIAPAIALMIYLAGLGLIPDGAGTSILGHILRRR